MTIPASPRGRLSGSEIELNQLELLSFSRENKMALVLLLRAARDYASARCLIVNGLPAGLVIGAESVEKFLKALILLENPDCNVRRFGHRIPDLLVEASRISIDLDDPKLHESARQLVQYFQSRYPDNPNQPSSMSTDKLADLDHFVVSIVNSLSMPRNAKFRTGLHAILSQSIDQPQFVSPEEHWIRFRNGALGPILDHLASDYDAMIEEVYTTERSSV
jgi:HEPN domain-containing protein